MLMWREHATELAAPTAVLPQSLTCISHRHCLPQDAAILQQQFGIHLQGVLDTQLLQGFASFADAAGSTPISKPTQAIKSTSSSADGTTTTVAAGNSHGPHTSSNDGLDKEQSFQPDSCYLGRLGLGKLYAMYGFSHPNKAAMHKTFNEDSRCVISAECIPKLTICSLINILVSSCTCTGKSYQCCDRAAVSRQHNEVMMSLGTS